LDALRDTTAPLRGAKLQIEHTSHDLIRVHLRLTEKICGLVASLTFSAHENCERAA
jgi:hypothetical protein